MNRTFITLIVGIGLGFLLAPAKGSETWKRVKDSLNDFKDDATDKAKDLVDQGRRSLKTERLILEDTLS
jgi:gas vesicle protein